MNIIELNNVWEMYRIKFIIEGKPSWDNFWALRDVSLSVAKGEVLGIIGENGAGKSTVLKLIAGMLKPDRGRVSAQGRVSGLLELGAGFQPELTGRENIDLAAGMFGLSKNEIDAICQKIIDFADIGKFIYAPVKCYSQGMFVRLAFAVAIHVRPDILLIDDTLAVGDEYFQRKCIKKIFELKETGMTILFVTHDMEMLRRLCQRGILLKDGRVIKDGLLEKVIPLYTQMVGSREGVGILKKEPLDLIFNNGRLFLNWDDRPLTSSNFGAHAVFLMSGRWHNSLEADWDVRKEGDNKLVATGRFYEFALIQTWRIEIAEPYEIEWEIEMESKDPLEISEACTNIMLSNEYTGWFTTLERGEFPPIDEKDKNWHAMIVGNIARRCIGVTVDDDRDAKIVPLSLEQAGSVPTGRLQIFNSDYLANCRMLQHTTSALQNYSNNQAGSFVYFSGKIKVNIPNIGHYLETLQDEFVLSQGKIKLIFHNGKIILLYNDLALTKGSHIDSAVYVNGRQYSSGIAQWEFKKQKSNSLVARGRWLALGIAQVWELEGIDDYSFLWKVSLEVGKDTDIEEQHVRFMFREIYHDWFSEYAGGHFPSVFLESETDMTQRCISDGVVGVKSKNDKFPTVYLEFPEELNNFAKIFNSDFYNKARILQIDRVEPEQKTTFGRGKYQYFATKISVKEEQYICPQAPAVLLTDGRMRFVFESGKGRIYWGEKELTKRLGFYTSLCVERHWHNSVSSAAWKIQADNGNTIKAQGRWLHLPLTQSWEIRLKEKGVIEININMRVDGAIEIERLQANLMLSENYREWIANSNKGIFPQFNGNIDDDWDVLWSNSSHKDKKKDYIGLLKNSIDNASLPEIIFLPEDMDLEWSLNIVNSDLYHRGRVLQYLKQEKQILSPGEYRYFRGKIKIEESLK